METRADLSFVVAVGLALLVAGGTCEAGVNRSAPTLPRPDASAWMPDVAERLQQLRDRLRTADTDARQRAIPDPPARQWWKPTAVAASGSAR